MAKAGAQVVIVQPNGLFINQRNTILRQASRRDCRRYSMTVELSKPVAS
jgi:hypothetical protein